MPEVVTSEAAIRIQRWSGTQTLSAPSSPRRSELVTGGVGADCYRITNDFHSDTHNAAAGVT